MSLDANVLEPSTAVTSRDGCTFKRFVVSVISILLLWQFIGFENGKILQNVNFPEEVPSTTTSHGRHQFNSTVTANESSSSSALSIPVVNDITPTGVDAIDIDIWIPNATDHMVSKRLAKTLSGRRVRGRKYNAVNNHPRNTTTLGVKYNPLTNCTPTTQFRLSILPPSSPRKEEWTIHSMDANGQPKTIGGDELYVTITTTDHQRDDDASNVSYHPNNNDPTAVAISHDNRDGTYRLEWVRPFMSRRNISSSSINTSHQTGRLTIHYQYTCGMGQLERPIKEDWYDGGMIRQVYTVDNIPMPLVIREPRIQTVDLSHYDQVVCFGDSTINNLCGKYFNKPVYSMPNMICRANAGMEYSNHTLPMVIAKIQEWHGATLKSSTSPNQTALLLGSAVWDILEPTQYNFQDVGFHDHIATVRRLLARLRQDYPNVTILWKLPQAFHVHVLEETCWEQSKCRERTKYLSSSLVKQLYTKQKSLMNEIGMADHLLLDYYEATYVSAGWMMPGDGRHYRRWINQALLKLSYNGNNTNSRSWSL